MRARAPLIGCSDNIGTIGRCSIEFIENGAQQARNAHPRKLAIEERLHRNLVGCIQPRGRGLSFAPRCVCQVQAGERLTIGRLEVEP